MTWLRLDDGFAQHPKIVGLTDSAFRLHVTALCYCNQHLTDGFIPTGMVNGWKMQKEARELVAAKLWRSRKDGWTVKDYLEYNRSRAEVESIRSSKRQAGAKGGATRALRQRLKQTGSHIHITPTDTPTPTDHGVIENPIQGGTGGLDEAMAAHPSSLSPDAAHLLASFPHPVGDKLLQETIPQALARFGDPIVVGALRSMRAASDAGVTFTAAGGFLWRECERIETEAMA